MEHLNPQCHHEEAHVHGLVDDAGALRSERIDAHDCDYVDARNVLIPFAEGKANKAVGLQAPKGTHEENTAWNHEWNRAFFAAMNELWAARCANVAILRRRQHHRVAA